MKHTPIKAVYFDAGGTLLTVRGSVGEIYAAAAARQGFPVEARSVQQAFRFAWARSLDRRRKKGWVSSDGFLRDEWRTIVADCFDGLVPPEAALRAFEELYEHFSGPEPWSIAPGALEFIAGLKARRVTVGILSNWDHRLPICLERLGIAKRFDHLVISYAVGVEKPHPRIFEEAARRCGAPAEATLMVGDTYEMDIAPAIHHGWRAAWLTQDPGTGDLPPGVEKVRDFMELRERFQEE